MTTAQYIAIGNIYNELRDQLVFYAHSSLGNWALAEEAVQETFQIVCLKPDEFLSSPNQKGWIIKTLKYTIQNIKRNRDHTALLMNLYLEAYGDSVTYSEDPVNLELQYGDVSHSEEFRLIREMAVEGKTHLEMAHDRGITVAACKKRVQRAKEFLKKKI